MEHDEYGQGFVYGTLKSFLNCNFIHMNLHEIKKVVERSIKWSWEKQVKLFMSSWKSKKFFKEAMKESKK